MTRKRNRARVGSFDWCWEEEMVEPFEKLYGSMRGCPEPMRVGGPEYTRIRAEWEALQEELRNGVCPHPLLECFLGGRDTIDFIRWRVWCGDPAERRAADARAERERARPATPAARIEEIKRINAAIAAADLERECDSGG